MEIEKQQWFNEEADQDIPVAEFDKLTEEMANQDKIVKDLEMEAKKAKELLTKMKLKLHDYLTVFGKSKYANDHGTFYTQTKFSVSTPKTPEEKEALFAFLKEKGIYAQYATVNSRSLQTLYKSFLESEGEDFKMPGVGEPKSFTELRFRKK